MNQNLMVIGEETRKKSYLLPKRVLHTVGVVTDAASLLTQKPLQIGLYEPCCTLLDNRGTGQAAGVLLDFGAEFHGGARILTSGITGAATVRARLCFGESAAEAMSHLGEKNANNDHSTRDLEVLIPALSDLEFAQTGYRFLFFELLDPETSIQIKSILGTDIHREIPQYGSFTCSDPLVNQIYQTAADTCHLCLQNMLWDGIKRDRLVWIGDIYPEMMTIRTLYGEIPQVEEALSFVRDQTPLPGWMNGMPAYSMWWVCILWDWYLHNGNREMLERQKSYFLALMQQLLGCCGADGSVTLPDYFLDWPTFHTPAAKSGVDALTALTMDAAAHLAAVYGEKSLADQCAHQLQLIRARKVSCYGFKQTAAMLLLEQMADPDKALQTTLQANGAHGLSTFMSYFIFTVLARTGGMEQALETMKTYYGGMLRLGATTFWEDFDVDWLTDAKPLDVLVAAGEKDVHGDNGAFCYQGFRHSLCHGWASGPVAFLAQEVLGVQILEPGCKKLRITPHLGQLKYASGSYPTPFGMVQISHVKKADGTVQTTYTAPKEVEILLP